MPAPIRVESQAMLISDSKQNESDTLRAATRTALVVDDDPLVAQFLADTLVEVGFDVVRAGTVATALTAARSTDRFAVAFVDLGLPDRSGLELIAELKELQPGLPVLVATGYGAMVQRDVDLHNRPPKFLPKPYSVSAIIQALTELGLPVGPPANN